MNGIFHTLRPQIARLAQARAVPVPVAVIGLLLAAGLNLVCLRPSAALSLLDPFPRANHIVLMCDLVSESTETITISESAFCEIAKAAIESLAQGKISPRVTRVQEWEHALEPDWPKRCHETQPGNNYCDPFLTQIRKSSAYLQVNVESKNSSLYKSNPSALTIRYMIRVIKNEEQEIVVWSYHFLLENGVTNEITARVWQRFPRWPGAIVHSSKIIPTQELVDEIQITLAREMSPDIVNLINKRASGRQ